jgi:outer membrane protein assembly factor BamA
MTSDVSPQRTLRTRRKGLGSSVRIYLCVLCVLCGVSNRVFADVSDYLGKPIGSVRVVVEGRDSTDPALIQVIETVVDTPLSMLQVRESITHLFSLGLFENVSVDATLENGRVALRYEISPIHPVARIRFAFGPRAPGIDEDALHRAILDRYGASPPVGRTADMTRLVADALGERGYLHPAIAVRTDTDHSTERATLVFTIDPGTRTKIGTVEVVGQPALPRAEFLRRLGAVSGTPFQRDALNERIQRYVDDRRRHGYYDARIVPAVQLADGDRVANLTLNVAPGTHVRVVFEGDSVPADKRNELVPVEREGSIDEDLLEDSSNRIEEFLRAQGYRDARAPYSRAQANAELVITFTVTRGPQYLVTTVDISENVAVPRAEFDASLKVRQGQPFSEARLDADVAAIEELYHRRGFAAAKAIAAVEPQTSSATPAQVPVIVRIVVREDVRTVVDGVTFEGNQALEEPILRAGLVLQPGVPYVPGQLARDRDAILLAYQNSGYESATVEAEPQFTPDRTHVSVRFAIREGPRIFVHHVLIVGNIRTRSETIERELRVKPGDPFSLASINESQRRLAALGLFRHTRISELRHGDEMTRDLLVTVEEAPPTTLGYGGGVEGRLRVVRREQDGGTVTESFEVAPRAFFEIGRRNLFGKNRSVNFFSSISLHPKDAPFFEDQPTTTTGGYGLTEYRVLGTFREPRLFNTAFDGFATVVFEQQIRSSFNFTRRGANLVAARKLTRDIAVSGSYQLQRTSVFDVAVSPEDLPLIDRAFPQFRLSSFSGAVIRDTRDDTVDPGMGDYVSASGQLAAVAIGSEVGFMKSFFTGQVFRTLPRTKRLIVAGNARLGLATGFNIVEQLPASERFFAGGDTTVRGFALDRLGVRHVPPQQGDTLDQDGVPIGGNGLVIFNAELRAPVTGGLGVVGFLDTGNVFAHATDLDLGQLRSAVGGGIRYKSPFGPIRLDLGFKVNRQPGEGLTAWFISFGQAF